MKKMGGDLENDMHYWELSNILDKVYHISILTSKLRTLPGMLKILISSSSLIRRSTQKRKTNDAQIFNFS